MKKILHISFAFIFAVLTVGITINKHYSGDELFSIALFGEADSCCELPCDCCDDESEVFQFTADYLFSVNYNVDQGLKFVELNADYTSDLLSTDTEINNFGVTYLFLDIPPQEAMTFLSRVQSFLL